MTDIADHIDSVHRELGTKRIPAGEAHVVSLLRTFDAPITDVWDALTSAERISHWFLPVTGDLKTGGTYQLEGNAGGRILLCKAPNRLKLTWAFGENITKKDISEVEVELSESDGGTVLTLEHAAAVDPVMWDQFGPGAVGVGWDAALFALAEYLRGHELDAVAWQESPESRELSTLSSRAWGEAYRAAGAEDATVTAVVEATTKFYIGELIVDGSWRVTDVCSGNLTLTGR